MTGSERPAKVTGLTGSEHAMGSYLAGIIFTSGLYQASSGRTAAPVKAVNILRAVCEHRTSGPRNVRSTYTEADCTIA